MSYPSNNNIRKIDETTPFYGILKAIVDNQQTVVTVISNALEQIKQWILELFDKAINGLRKQIYPNEQRNFSYLPYFPYFMYYPSS